jgi:hypothetical protein
MAIFTFKTTLKYADELCRHERMFDMREKAKGVKVGDVIKYEPWYAGRAVQGHDILDKRFRVVYVDGEDPRVMLGFDIFQLEEIVPEFE